MITAPNLFPSFPAALALAGIAFELARLATRRFRRFHNVSAWTFAAWTVRPWTAWAFFNLFYRWRWEAGFNERLTFPFYAIPWAKGESFAEGLRRIWTAPNSFPWLFAALASAAAICALLCWFLRIRPRRAWPSLALLVGLAASLHVSIACLPNADWSDPNRTSSIMAAWNRAGSTMLYSVPHVKSSGDYFRRFIEIQPKIRSTIHGLSHPPAASLSLYWIGKAMGLEKGANVRLPDVRLRYSLGLILFGTINACVLFCLGRSLFNASAGFLAAALWTTAPSVASYASFAQDSLYAVFFNLSLWLGWQTVTAERRPAVWAVLLGCSFFAMVFLSYSWCLATTMFALFAAFMGWRNRWSLSGWIVRAAAPLAVMSVLSSAVLAWHRLDYWTMYRFANHYVVQWYPFTGPYQWTMALLGGQLDLFLLLGSVACSAFVASALGFRRQGHLDPRWTFLAIVLGVFALPLLFGPNCLKMEAARCWIWIASVPLAFAADRLLHMPSRWFAVGAPAVSAATALSLRLFLDFGV